MKLLANGSLALSLLLLELLQAPAKGFPLKAFADFEGSNTFQFAATQRFDPITIDGADVQRSIQLNVLALNLGTGDGDIEFNFEFKDTNDNVATITQMLTANIDSPKSLFFAYRDRVESTSDAGGDINLANVDYILFYTSDENVGDDFTFDLLQTSQTIPFKFSPGLSMIIVSGFLESNLLKKRINKSS
ncbi:hypothetical protein Xen7305DRAFT_00015550 [Xenococcus sp. PCC 7305]|uniref:hypothetical protein n=1 Tax=Xenococcus sp. PCC 7305 TaxID=102125 RepID=UPI0002AC8009|nr:hypothetical protein [Xenococcus sp. PCC 7305]ELS01848.1 hypothetical protein Xen7305DRAFT_00015550 [Xenococcus sp. PCC 7305]